jgi:hypothetical protein
VPRLADDPLPYHPGYVQPPGGRLGGAAHTATTAVLGDHGFPTAATFDLDDLHLAIDPVAFAPVLLADGTGRISRFPRALCRFTDPAGGRSGVGWTEWNQPSA